MIQLNAQNAKEIVGGQAKYTYIYLYQINTYDCMYGRYKKSYDKYGNDLGTNYYDGQEKHSCARGWSWNQ